LGNASLPGKSAGIAVEGLTLVVDALSKMLQAAETSNQVLRAEAQKQSQLKCLMLSSCSWRRYKDYI
jgi:hypothetical protein